VDYFTIGGGGFQSGGEDGRGGRAGAQLGLACDAQMTAMIEMGVVAALFCAVHLAAARLYLWQTRYRSAWLSGAAGISVAYVFVDILPDFAAHHRKFVAIAAPGLIPIEQRIYFAALVGFVFFFGLQNFLFADPAGDGHGRSDAAFWLQIAGYALYSFLVAYLLEERGENGMLSLIAYAIAMALHLAVADHNLMRDFGERFERAGTWILAGSVVAGAVTNALIHTSAIITAYFFAFIAGGVVMTSMNEELSHHQRGQFWWFLAGAAASAALLMA
jgi:hypothetical protein